MYSLCKLWTSKCIKIKYFKTQEVMQITQLPQDLKAATATVKGYNYPSETQVFQNIL